MLYIISQQRITLNYPFLRVMNNVSFIISIDNSYEMSTNFFESFLNNDFVKSSEIIIVNDCVDSILTINYLNQIATKYNNVKLINLETKSGYGVANNIGVDASSCEYLFFINIDVFAKDDCFEKMLNALICNEADCVQPLLIWPQNRRIQCAGSFFGPYYKNHLFAGRKPSTIDFSKINNKRLALTSALYAMKKTVFYENGKFDEFYYNKLESFELSLKLTLNGKKCICIPNAIAYHSQGTGRNQYYFDFYQQEAHFWSNFGNRILPDIVDYYEKQITFDMKKDIYSAISISQTRGVKELLTKTSLSISNFIEINGINPNKINLYELLPYSFHKQSLPILFFVENILNLSGNKKWFEERDVKDIVLDTYGNLLYVEDI